MTPAHDANPPMPFLTCHRHAGHQRVRRHAAMAIAALAGSLVAPAGLQAQYVSPRPQVVAKASGPVSTLFGIPVGARLSAEPLVPCSNTDATLARRPCDDSDPARNAAVLERVGLSSGVLAAREWRLIEVRVDDALAGTALLVGSLGRVLPFDVVVDRQNVVQFVSIPTPSSEQEGLLAMLSAKYGKPMRIDATEWASASGAAATRSTPNYFWDFANVHIAYRSETGPSTSAVPMATGDIRVALPGFADAGRPVPAAAAAR